MIKNTVLELKQHKKDVQIYVSLFGKDNAKNRVASLYQQAITALTRFKADSTTLCAFIDHIMNRDH
jgi:hypothetical protein